jgi:hypothetical protein
MMINPPSPQPDERRKAARVQFEPLRVRLNGSREGIVMDLSEAGALLVMATAPPRDNPFTITIEWRDTAVIVAARVVRSEQRQVRLEAATLARRDYAVALEFVDMTPDATSTIRRIITAT